MSSQKIILVGNLGQDPELRYMPDSTPVTNFSLAVNRSWSDSQSGEKVSETTWFRVAVWGGLAETANQYLTKGRQVLVEGRLKADPSTGGPRLWQRADGSLSASFELTAEVVRFIGATAAADDPAAAEEDEIPF